MNSRNNRSSIDTIYVGFIGQTLSKLIYNTILHIMVYDVNFVWWIVAYNQHCIKITYTQNPKFWTNILKIIQISHFQNMKYLKTCISCVPILLFIHINIPFSSSNHFCRMLRTFRRKLISMHTYTNTQIYTLCSYVPLRNPEQIIINFSRLPLINYNGRHVSSTCS